MKPFELILTESEITSLIRAIDLQIESYKNGIEKQKPGESVVNIVRCEIAALLKTRLYLKDAINPKDEYGKPITQG